MKKLCLLLCLVLLTACAPWPGENHFHEEDGILMYDGHYEGDYAIRRVPATSEEDYPQGCRVMSLSEYADFCAHWGIEQVYIKNQSYAVYTACVDNGEAEADIGGVEYNEETGELTLYIYEFSTYSTSFRYLYLYAVPLEREVTSVTKRCLESQASIEWMLESAVTYAKPILYLYPREETEVTVTLGKPETLTCTYPVYEDGWQVTACPDGTLLDSTGRSYYALYWEAHNDSLPFPDGFVVARDDLIPFLEEKLDILGLNEREAEEFIVYWLPILQESPYRLIRFAEPQEIEALMPLSISPAPDTLIRVFMQQQALSAPIEIPTQNLTPTLRTGFVAVEWGGSRNP